MLSLAALADTMTAERTASSTASGLPREARLWIDGVGCWLVWLPERLTIGGPQPASSDRRRADLPLLADLRRCHAAIERAGEQYRLIPTGPSTINGETIEDETGLRSGDEISLGAEVRFQFTIPTQLSNSARLVCTSGHRPEQRIDGIILLEQMCQLGPREDHHIVCPHSEDSFVLFQKRGEVWCRSSEEWTLDGTQMNGSAKLNDGAVVAGESLQFRVELRSA